MNIKDKVINLLLVVFSIYLPLSIFSAFSYYISTKSTKDSNNFTKQKFLDKDKNMKLEAVSNGYLPFFTPNITKKNILNNQGYPIGSLPMKKTYLCNEGYGLIKYKSDRFGLRNSDKKWKKINNKSNIFLIGDSFTHGACVPEQFTIPSFIERQTGINTINLGSSGN